MIKYDLKCSAGHGFDAWFRNSDSFEEQSEAGQIACPVCGATSIAKAPMAPRIGRGKPSPDVVQAQAAVLLRQQLVAARRHIEAEFDHVGERFPEEARKIHYGETEARAIYGDASAEEATALADEGIEIGRIPWVELNDA